jgi:hypothetical protein
MLFPTRGFVGDFVLMCNTLQHTATHCNTLEHTATHCLPRAATHGHTATKCKQCICNVSSQVRLQQTRLQYLVAAAKILFLSRGFVGDGFFLGCNTPPYTVTHCNTLQNTATHCNTLPHTATHCNMLQHAATR